MNRKAAFVLGALFAVTTAVYAAGGFPSRPRFQTVGINQAPAAAAGTLRMTSATGGMVTVNSTHANGPWQTFARNGTGFADIGNGGQMGASFTLDSLALMARTGNKIELGANSSGPQLSISAAGLVSIDGNNELLKMQTSTARGSGNAWLQFYDPTGAKGYVGYGGANDNFYVSNLLNGAMLFYTNNALAATISTAQVTDFVATPTVNGDALAVLTSGTFSGGDIVGCSSGGADFLDGDWQKVGNYVFIRFDPQGSTCTSNSTSFSISGLGLPAGIIPATRSDWVALPPGLLINNGAGVSASAYINSSGNLILRNGTGAIDASWTSSGNKGFASAADTDFQVIYRLQ